MHDRAVVCATNEYSRFDPPFGQTCGEYLATNPGGALLNAAATTQCEYCPLVDWDQSLASVAIS
jgi:ABC-type multidrug transport system permease subunit